MERFYVFIISNAIWILILCVLGIIWYLIQLVSRQRELKRSSFYLERERAASDRNTAMFLLIAFAGIISLVWYVNSEIRPNLPASAFLPSTPTPDLLATALATPDATAAVVQLRLPTSTPVMAPTITLVNPELLEAIPATPVPELDVNDTIIGCEGGVVITEPLSGETIPGAISLFGRATSPTFSFYQIEIKGPFTDERWQSLLDGVVNSPVENGFLGSANFAGWTTGIYQIRLAVIDVDSIESGSCLIEVGIIN